MFGSGGMTVGARRMARGLGPIAGQSNAAMRRKLVKIVAMITAADGLPDPWSAAEYSGATVTSLASTTPAGAASNGTAAPKNPKRWTTTPTEIQSSGGLDATLATNYHDAISGMVSSGQINRSWQCQTYGTCDTQTVYARMLGTPSGLAFVQLGSKFVSKAGHTLFGTSGTQWLTIDRGASFDPNDVIRIWYSTGVDGLYPATGGTVTPNPTPTYNFTLGINGDSIVDGTGPTSPVLGFAPRLAWLLGFPRCIPTGVQGSGLVTVGSGYTNINRLCNLTGFNNSEMIAAGTTNAEPNADVIVMDGTINDLATGVPAATVGAALTDFLNLARQTAPSVPVVVLGPPDRNAPGAVEANFDAYETAMAAACAGRKGVVFMSLKGYSFSKVDATHPDDAGSITMAGFKYTQVKAGLISILLALS